MDNNYNAVCPFCGTEITDGDEKICPSCKTAHHSKCWDENNGCAMPNCSGKIGKIESEVKTEETAKAESLVEIEPVKDICSNCGAELATGQRFCPECGQKIGLASICAENNLISIEAEGKISKKNKGKKILLISVITILILAIISAAALCILKWIEDNKIPDVEKVNLSITALNMQVDDMHSVTCKMEPENAQAEIVWKSSDENVAKVSDDGKVFAVGEGMCTITATAGEKSDTLIVTVEDVVDFQVIYDECNLESSYAEVGYDGSYLSIDTNPNDFDDYMDYYAYISISVVNEHLGLPDSLSEEMDNTSRIDGRQSESFENAGITVTWTYHPDKGLEVIYKRISN